ncbi:Hypothetical protein SMAX5B_011355 [Scophthalmus maximus]|uniref:Uncharacterized protein n=1 Tax=Scophthalmus maximus TaxID=52904 RepID=A0A2U9BNT5_SCOMX|nr:Hypothetical protein SMAX5B_011355 [Scophthalmus maximus]
MGGDGTNEERHAEVSVDCKSEVKRDQAVSSVRLRPPQPPDALCGARYWSSGAAHRGDGELRQASRSEADRIYTDVTFTIRRSATGSK